MMKATILSLVLLLALRPRPFILGLKLNANNFFGRWEFYPSRAFMGGESNAVEIPFGVEEQIVIKCTSAQPRR